MNYAHRFESPQTAPLSPERARVEEFILRKDQKSAAAHAMFDNYQAERDAVNMIERAIPSNSPYLRKTLAELSAVTVEKERHVRGRAEDDPSFQLGECRRAAVHRERAAQMKEAGDRLGAEAAALNSLIANCTKWLDAKEGAQA
jgi:hypothetical protein